MKTPEKTPAKKFYKKKSFAKAGRVVKAAFDVAKEAKLIESQQMFETLSMPALTTAVKAIDLLKRASAGRSLPVFSGTNRKVVIPTVSTGTVSTSVYGYKYNDKGIPRKLGDVNTQVRKNTSYTISSSANSQQVLDVPQLSCSGISSGTDNYTSVTFEDAFDTVFNVAGANPTISLASSAIDQNRLALDRFESTLKIQNPNDSAMEVTIYDLLPKRDMPVATYQSRFSATGLQSPVNAWVTGLTNAIDVNDTTQATTLGVLPTTTLKFNTFWKVMKRTKIELSAGSSHIHRGCNLLNTIFNHYDYSEVLGLRAMLCPTIMLVFNGMPTSSLTAESVTINYSVENVLFARGSVNDNITVRNYDNSIS